MKQPKNQKDLLTLLTEQDAKIKDQDKQIQTMKLALLRLEQRLRKVSVLAERVSGNQGRISERVRLTESKLKQL